jgi:putative flippase GtrA
MRRALPEFIRFVVAGAINTGATYALYLICLLALPYLAAYSISYIAGLGISFLLNSHFVFRKPANGIKSYSIFALVYAVQFIVSAVLLWLIVDRIGIMPQVALIFVLTVSVPLTYLGLRSAFQGRVN